ncbi:hypothetical protein HY504_00135 [Candidatus Wolfebacteria bacterium]|nr:hypothetical protein [Candidatus Wolfebacteria bacterium]
MSKSKLFAVIIIVVLVVSGAYFLWSRGGLTSLNLGSPNSENQGDAGVPAGGESADMSETYTSPDYGFSFKYPKGFNATELSDDSGDTVLVQNAEEKSGFQIYITPFDEAEPLTAARIMEDLPASEVIDPKDVLIGEGKAINAVIFLSTSPSFGKTREIWFTHEGNLYQVTTYEGQDNFIGPILETIEFR